MPRVNYVEKDQVSGPVKDVYEQMEQAIGIVPNIIKVVGHSSAASQAMGSILGHYFGELSIDVKTREIAYLTVARLNGCAYCQGHHVPLAKQSGLSDEQIEHLSADSCDKGGFSDAEQAVIRFADETTSQVKASQEAFDALKSHFSEQEIVDIGFVVATGNFIQRIGKNFEIDLES